MFALGLLDLPDKAKIESLYWEISREVVQSFEGRPHMPEEIRKLEESLGDQFLCNFSVFQSLLDHWALGQLFPIMPISHLNEAPAREGTLVDITCDSDGQVNKFIDPAVVRDTLPLHGLRANGQGPEPYYLGFFLMGAYQDIMGDLHNLFGRVNEVHVFLDPDEPTGYYVEEIIEGSTIVQTLTSVQYDEHELKRQMKMQVDEAIKSDRLKPSEGMRLLDDFERGLKDYTYLRANECEDGRWNDGGWRGILVASSILHSLSAVALAKADPSSPPDMPDAAKAELLRALGRLVRGLSALFWGLALTGLVCLEMVYLESAQMAWRETFSPLAFLPAFLLSPLLWHGLNQCALFRRRNGFGSAP